ncbi:MAG TPA: protein kinase [Gemmatimonadales bacterium]|nr:protein kinase [Gemmatimonadales bacterium]
MSNPIDRLTPALSDRYRVDHELGAGGMATVYLADDIKHDRKVAIKVLRPELAAVIGAERFLKEIKTTANLQHPHILGLIDSGNVDGLLWYAMPFIQGESLRDRLQREKQLPVTDAVRITIEVASALDYAHRHGVIHRDIKPENILLHDGSALVADFGIALAASSAGTRMTETGMSLGTPHYMSPEQAMGEREITARSDVYALGCVAYEMLVGEPPFNGPTAQAIIARVMTEEPRSITLQRKTVPPHVEAAVLTALEKLPADRYASAAEFAAALSDASAPSAHRTTGRNAALSPRRTVLPWAVAVIAVVVGAWGWIQARAAADRPVQVHYLSLGDSVQLQRLATTGPPLALSPDGSRMVFVGDTLARLWIKRRDALEPTVIAGTEGASSPVFSPDGNWIAYVADTHVKKVRVDGGQSIALADSVGPGCGLAWLDDGTLVYPTLSLLGLRRVSQSGGAATETVPDALFKGLAPMLPTPLPHARGIIFGVCASGCVAMSLHVLDFKTGKEKLLVNDVGMGWYLPTGNLLYVRRDGVALVVPFDLSTLQMRGAAVPVLQGVALTLSVAALAWSPSGELVYGTGSSGIDIVTLHHADRTGKTVAFDPTWTGQFNSFAMSPDGRRVAVGAGGPSGSLDIWVKDLDRGPFARLTFSGHDRRPAWSPDGREIAFIRDSGSGGDVFVRPVDGGGAERRMAHLDRAVQEIQWSHDGHWILVRTESGAAGNGDILALRTQSDSAPVPVATSNFTELQPIFSPDGRWVAYVSNEAVTPEVYVRPFPNSSSGRWQVSNGGGGSPAWSADGKELFFINSANRIVAAELGAGPGFSVKEVKPLFDAMRMSYIGYHQAFETTKDGGFIFLGPLSGTISSTRLVQIDNWFADLKAKAKQ